MAYNKELSTALNKIAESKKPETPMKKSVINTRVDEETLKNIDAYAKATGKSRSKAVNDLINRGFKHIIEHQND